MYKVYFDINLRSELTQKLKHNQLTENNICTLSHKPPSNSLQTSVFVLLLSFDHITNSNEEIALQHQYYFLSSLK